MPDKCTYILHGARYDFEAFYGAFTWTIIASEDLEAISAATHQWSSIKEKLLGLWYVESTHMVTPDGRRLDDKALAD